jgi:hypothetical protein
MRTAHICESSDVQISPRGLNQPPSCKLGLPEQQIQMRPDEVAQHTAAPPVAEHKQLQFPLIKTAFSLIQCFCVGTNQANALNSSINNSAFTIIQPKTVGSKVTELASGNCISVRGNTVHTCMLWMHCMPSSYLLAMMRRGKRNSTTSTDLI